MIATTTCKCSFARPVVSLLNGFLTRPASELPQLLQRPRHLHRLWPVLVCQWLERPQLQQPEQRAAEWRYPQQQCEREWLGVLHLREAHSCPELGHFLPEGVSGFFICSLRC
jgi:hypothetical protein